MKIDLGQMCIYDKVAKYVVQAECREPLHIGTGSGEQGEVLVHPEENRPFVQATGIAGAFRGFYKYNKGLQARLFGVSYKDYGEDESITSGSRVFFTDGFFEKSTVYTEIRPRLRIDGQSGTGQSFRTKGSGKKSGQKFEIESVAAGSRFTFAIYVYEKDEDLETAVESGLKALHEGCIQLGGQKSNGCGYVTLLSLKKAVYDFYNSRDRDLWAEESKCMDELLPGFLGPDEVRGERIHFELFGHTESGMLVKSIAVAEYGEDVPDAVNIRNHRREYILPASSIKGVIRSQIEKIAAYKGIENVVADIFGQESDDGQTGKAGKIRCFDCVIGNTDDNDKARVQHRIHIDKFTGGVIYGGLFSEKPAYGKLSIRLELEGDSRQESGLILMALRDLAMGITSMGSGSSIGRGYIKGDQIRVRKGNQTLAEIDCQRAEITSGSQYVEQCLKALEQTGEDRNG